MVVRELQREADYRVETLAGEYRIVPTMHMVLWVHGEEHAAFELPESLAEKIAGCAGLSRLDVSE